MNLSDEARKAKNEYSRQWRAKNRQKCNEYNKKWREANKDKIKEYVARYWEKKSQQAEKESVEAMTITLRNEGMSLRKIAQHLKISHMKVKRILEQNNKVYQ